MRMKSVGKNIRVDAQHSPGGKGKIITYVSLIVLVAQNAAQMLLMRYVRTLPREMFMSTVAVVMTEIVKLIACFFLVCFEEKGLSVCLKKICRRIFCQKIDTLKVCVPALIYVLQNNLLYVAVSNLAASTYMVVYQLKILASALFTVLILRRRLSILQWIALFLLFGGIALVQLGEQRVKDADKLMNGANATIISQLNSTDGSGAAIIHEHIINQNPVKGFMAVLAAAIMSGFAGIYFEKILKTTDVSIWIRNIQLALISLPVALATVFIKDSEKVLDKGFFVGFHSMVWVTILVGSLGGLTVAVVIKFADNILKAFATSIAIIVACTVSVFLFNFIPSYIFIVGTILVISAVFMYNFFPYQERSNNTAVTDPLNSALVKVEE